MLNIRMEKKQKALKFDLQKWFQVGIRVFLVWFFLFGFGLFFHKTASDFDH